MFSVLPFSTILLHGVNNKPRKGLDFVSWSSQINANLSTAPVECKEALPKDETIRLRHNLIGKACAIHYQNNPIKIVRGLGTYLYDEQGNRYLDCVNNVTHVGHCHPHVIRACDNQMKQLNTNNRFLHDSIVQYAERILAKLPEKLKVCFFTCTGSEANDLALRMARIHTGHEDIVVLDNAYHGHTSLLMELSAYKQKQMNKTCDKDYVHVVTTPDPYRGKYRGYTEETGVKYANEVNETVENAQKNGRKVAAFLVESAQGCGGQIIFPDGFLKHSFKHIREAGGVCIADEVQTGFGRIGDNFWVFEGQDVVPDIVTMGKPIANGHPISLVVTTQEIADSFGSTGATYFNTFGGNPVSCEVAHAVLDVIEEEGLQKNALEVGNFMLKHLKELQKVHPLIGDVRGKGFYIGIELVTDRDKRIPATAEALQVKTKLKDRYIILSVDGPDENVLKFKPPMCFSRMDGEFLLSNLNEVFSEVEATMRR
ncbi:ethanolamine-phosphate phospho-lyase-like isoform X1 [Dendronephthya gigantea]|uniref:ethanolamine-phosphate phospho-lyase-like isoform X1 n=1 Tax=Dendronephthya gigantea TaxID=151771 RepID=UPI00106C0099|nr:ethanolamine-phosphate phospho-lyase-like isoform X1 [Dendronephthya gigantea]